MLAHTSEQMVYVNLIAGMIADFSRKTGRQVSVLAPTTGEERSLGFDGLFSGLSQGFLIALQFKRPYPHPTDIAKFTVTKDQCHRLAGWGSLMAGLYVLCPYVSVTDFLNAGRLTLAHSAFVDCRVVWNSWTGKGKQSRTITYEQPVGSGVTKITDPWTYDELPSQTWDDIIARVQTRDVPLLSREEREQRSADQPTFGGFGRTFYLHIESD